MGKPYETWSAEQQAAAVKLMRGRGIDLRHRVSAEDAALADWFFTEWTAAIERNSELRKALDPAFVAFYQPVPAVDAGTAAQFPPQGWAARLQAALAGPPGGPSHCAIQSIGGNSNTLFLVTAVNYVQVAGFGTPAARDHAAARAFAQFMLAGFPGSGIVAYITPEHTYALMT